MPPAHGEVAMTQPNPGPAPAAPDPNQNPTPAAPATGPATPPTTSPPTPPGFQPATGDPATAGGEDDQAQQLLAAAVQADDQAKPQGTPDSIPAGDKRQILAELAKERDRRQALENQLGPLLKDDLGPLLKADLGPLMKLVEALGGQSSGDTKTDLEKLTDRLTEHEKALGEERQIRWRLEIAADKGLTRDQAAELRGTTQDELAAHADRLLALFPKAPAPEPAPAGQPDGATPNGQQPAAQPEPAATGPKPDPSQGARGPVDIHAQIQDALAKGDTRTSIALKQQLAAQQRGGTQ